MPILATLIVEYTADLSDLEKGTQKATQLIEKFEKAASSAGSGASKLADAQAKAAQAADKVKAAETSASSALGKVDQSAKKAAMSMTKTAEKASHMSNSFSKIKSVGSSVGGAFSSVGKSAASAGGGLLDFGSKLGMSVIGLGGLVEGLMGVGSALISGTANMEQARVSYMAFLGDAKVVDTFLRDLASFAATTPFEFTDVQDAGLKLLNMGVAAKDAQSWLTNLGNAVAKVGGNGETLNDVTGIISQMAMKGKITTEEMMQLTDRNIPAFKILADAMGVPVDQLQEMITKGEVGRDKIDLLTEAMGKWGNGAMTAQGETFNGMLSTLIDNFNLALNTFTKPLFDLAKSGLKGLGDFLSSDAFKTFSEGAGKALADTFTVIGEMAAQAAPHFQTLGEKIAPIVANIIAWMDKNDVFEKVMQTMFNIGSSLADTFGELADVVGPMVQDFLKWAEENHVLEITLAAIEGAVDGVGEVIKFAAPIVAEIIKKVAEFGKEIADRLQPSIEKFSKWWGENWPHIQQVFEGVWKGIQGVAELAWSIISGIFKIGLDIFNGDWEQAWEDAKEMFAGAWEGIKKIFEGWWDIISGIVKTAWNTYLAKPFDELWKSVTKWWDDLVKAASEIGGKIIDAIASGIRNFGGGIGDAIKGAVHGAAASLGITLPGFAEGVTDFSGGLAVVGERGPELVYLPQHSSVIPMSSSPSSVSSVSPSRSGVNPGGGDIYLTVQVGDEQLAQYVFDRMDSRVRAKYNTRSRVA